MRLPYEPRYAIRAPETVSVVVPAAAVKSKRAVAAPSIVFEAEGGDIRALGSLLENTTDLALRSVAFLDLVVVLDGDYFLPSIGLDSAETTAFLDGLKSDVSAAQNELGWAATVRPLLSHTSLQRLNESAVRLRVPPTPRYRSALHEALTIDWNTTAPADGSAAASIAVTTSRKPYHLPLTAIVPTGTPRGVVGGSILASLSADALRGTETLLNVTLHLPGNASLRIDNRTAALLLPHVSAVLPEGRREDGSVYAEQARGWNALHRDGGALSVYVMTPTHVSFSVAPAPTYAIAYPETIRVTIPAELLLHWEGGDLACEPQLRIAPSRPQLRLKEDGAPVMLINAFAWTAELELPTPLAGVGLAPSEVRRTAQHPKNFTLRLHDGSTRPYHEGGGPSEDGITDLWVPEEATPELLVGSFASAQQQPHGWNEVVRYNGAALPNVTVYNETLVLAWEPGQFADYAPREPETISLTIPAAAVASGVPLTLGSFVVTVDAGAAALSGTLLDAPTEEGVRSSTSQTLQISLSDGDTWRPEVGLDDGPGGLTAALLSSLVSAQPDADVLNDNPDAAEWWEDGWGAVVRPTLSYADVERVDARTLVLTVAQAAGYDVRAPETLRWGVPSATTMALHAYAPGEEVALRPQPGTAKFSGALMVRNTDASLQDDAQVGLTIRLTGDTWADGVDAGGDVTRALLGGLLSAQAEAYGWNKVVRPFLDAGTGGLNLTLVSPTELAVGIPSIPLYDIGSTESISLAVPGAALVSGQGFAVADTFVIYPAPPTATILSALLPTFTEFEVQSMAPFVLQVKLTGATFARDLAEYTAVGVARSKALLAGLQPSAAQPSGWAAVVAPGLQFAHVARLGDTLANITIPQFGTYYLAGPETISLTVPSLAITYEPAEVVAAPVMVITPLAVSATLGGSLLAPPNHNEGALRAAAPFTIEITISGTSWGRYTQVNDGGSGPTSALLAGIRSAQDEPSGWNAIVRPVLGPQHVRRFGDVVQVMSPPSPARHEAACASPRASLPDVPCTTLTVLSVCGRAGDGAAGGGLPDLAPRDGHRHAARRRPFRRHGAVDDGGDVVRRGGAAAVPHRPRRRRRDALGRGARRRRREVALVR